MLRIGIFHDWTMLLQPSCASNPALADACTNMLCNVLETSQVIKKHYAELPDKLGKLLAKQKKSDHHKGEAEREAGDDRQEEKYLREEGFSKDEIEDAVPEEDPVTAGTED